MRIFIALDIPAEIRDRIGAYSQRVRNLAPDSRWSKPEAMHVTLKFVGECDETRVQQIKSALAGIKARPFSVEFKDVGFFPGERAPRIFWAGVTTTEELTSLASSVDAALQKIGIPREEKPYRPHLTLGRVGSAGHANHAFQQLPGKLGADASPRFGTMTAQEFFLYKSEPLRGGSHYTKLERFPLEPAS